MNVLGADDVLKKLLRAREVPSDRPAVAAKLCEPGFYFSRSPLRLLRRRLASEMA